MEYTYTNCIAFNTLATLFCHACVVVISILCTYILIQPSPGQGSRAPIFEARVCAGVGRHARWPCEVGARHAVYFSLLKEDCIVYSRQKR
jgi:hypothetical protein